MIDKLLPIAILAGGLATRLRPMTESLPKALIKLNGEPFIAHQLRLLKQSGFNHVVMCVGYLGEMIEDFVGDGSRFDLHVQYSYDGTNLLGTGGAVKHAQPLLGNSFFVIYGDSYLPCDYLAIQRSFFRSHQLGLMTVFHNTNRWDTSNIEFLDNKIISYDKKNRTDRMQYIDYGVGVLTKSAIEYISGNEPYDLATLYQTLLRNNQLAAHIVDKRFYETGSFAGIKELEYYLKHHAVEAELFG